MYYKDRNLNNKSEEEEEIVRERKRMYEERKSHPKFERECEKKQRAKNALFAKQILKNEKIKNKQ